jgi:hypothetical protein
MERCSATVNPSREMKKPIKRRFVPHLKIEASLSGFYD